MNTQIPSTTRPGDTRVPVGHATYGGGEPAYHSMCDRILSGDPMGPNYMGELMWPVSADYDPDTETTRVGFSYQAPAVSS